MANIEKYSNLMKKKGKSKGKTPQEKNEMAKTMVKQKMNGMHKMPGGHMMKDAAMKKMMSK